MALYDVNFCFPVAEKIENARVALTPFIPAAHGDLFLSESKLYPEMFRYLPFGPLNNQADLAALVDGRVQPDPGYMLFCVWDKTKEPHNSAPNADGALAGLIGYINSSTSELVTEIGCVMILPPFHRTHVATNAAGLLIHYALELEHTSASVNGQHHDVFTVKNGSPLALRRVVWQANALNVPSIRLAERMGFKAEGILRWDRVLVAEKPGNGLSLREGDPIPHTVGRDTALLSLCWDDWEGGAREKVQQAMRRTS